MTQIENRAGFGNVGHEGPWIAAAALAGAISVVAGAFAAHGLDPVTEAKEIEWLRTGSQYQGLHALAILLTCALAARLSGPWSKAARWLFLIGAVLFPTALYVVALHGPHWISIFAPIGGTSFILGWLALAAAALLQRRS
jgi:uncharacterized membrane protein YgdD (TMEM256/DUF423 family)